MQSNNHKAKNADAPKVKKPDYEVLAGDIIERLPLRGKSALVYGNRQETTIWKQKLSEKVKKVKICNSDLGLRWLIARRARFDTVYLVLTENKKYQKNSRLTRNFTIDRQNSSEQRSHLYSSSRERIRSF